MAVDTDLSTPLEQVRLNIGDTDGELITDQTISALLVINEDNIRKTTIDCLKAIVADLAKYTREEVGEVKIWAQDQYKQYKSLLDDWKNDISYLDNLSLHYFGGTSKAAASKVQGNSDSRRINIKQGQFTDSDTGCSTDLSNPSFIDCD